MTPAIQLSTLPRATPNFFLVGAAKAGTTSLYHYLDQHPQIYMSPVKEPQYFADEIRLENFTDDRRPTAEAKLVRLHKYLQGPMSTKFLGGPISEWQDYLKLFDRANGAQAIGEASASYLWSESAPRNLAATFPEARILIMLRDPAERAFSQYLHMLTSVARSHVPFREYVETARQSTSTRIGKLYPFLHFGLYYEQVKRYFALFPREQIHIYFYEDYQRDPLALLQDVFRFLRVDQDFMPDFSERYMLARVPRSYAIQRMVRRVSHWELVKKLNVPVLRRGLRRLAFRPRNMLTLDSADRARLVEYYSEDIRKLASLLNRDLSAWLSATPTR